MMRFLSPESKVRQKSPEPRNKVGRPKTTAVEGTLSLGEKRPRACSSKKGIVDEQRMKEMERRLQVLETVHSEQGCSDEKVLKVLSLHEEAEEENKHLRAILQRRSGSGNFETPDRRPSKGMSSPSGDEIPWDGPGKCEAFGRAFGELGNCQAARELGNCQAARELGNCQAAIKGGMKGGKQGDLSPEALEKCRQAGMKGKEYGVLGGRPKNECENNSASRSAQKGVLRPQKWEPQAGHQLNALRYIREQLRTMRLGAFFQEEGQEEEWQEPKGVEDHVWIEIRKTGICWCWL